MPDANTHVLTYDPHGGHFHGLLDGHLVGDDAHTHRLSTVPGGGHLHVLLDGRNVGLVAAFENPHDAEETWYVPHTAARRPIDCDLVLYDFPDDADLTDLLDRCHRHTVDEAVDAVVVTALCPHDHTT